MDKLLDELQHNSPRRVLSLGRDDVANNVKMAGTPQPDASIRPPADMNLNRASTEIRSDPATEKFLATQQATAGLTGQFLKKLRASTKIPIEHKMSDGGEYKRFGN